MESMDVHEREGKDVRLRYAHRCIMAALYLPGLARAVTPKRGGARRTLGVLLANSCGLADAQATLERAGLWEESLCLSHERLLARAEDLVEERRVLTMACESYPHSWASMGSPPPALWMEGDLPEGTGLGIVGSREPPASAAEFARQCALEAIRLGYAVFSGGAPGCDREAGKASGPNLVEVIPCGIRARWGVESGCRLSARDPDELFTTAAAMERNALLYACGVGAVLCHARFKTGGAWVGATSALRRRLHRVMVWNDPTSLASRALIALGGIPLDEAGQLSNALSQPMGQSGFFDGRS